MRDQQLTKGQKLQMAINQSINIIQVLPGTVVSPPSPAGPHSSFSICPYGEPSVDRASAEPYSSTYFYCIHPCPQLQLTGFHFSKAREGLERRNGLGLAPESQGHLLLDKGRKVHRTCSYPHYSHS